MAKRRLNKNLVAFMTIAGIALAVIVVVIATINMARRDPEAIALKAKAQEEAGDPRRAINLYTSAYGESKDAKYLIEAARVARDMGELNMMFGLLNGAYADSPDDPRVLHALLVRYWEIHDFGMGQWQDVMERARKLCDQEPENLLALASLAEALELMKSQEPAYADEADEILRRATEIDPTSSYVALVRAKQSLLRARERIRDALRQGRRSEVAGIVDAMSAERVGFLEPALEAHPDDVSLRIACAQALAENERWSQVRELLEEGIEKQAEDPDLRYELARVYLQEIEQKRQTAVEEVRAQLEGATVEEARARITAAERASIDQDLIAEALRHTQKAVEIEPALYKAYSLRVNLQRLGWLGDGSWKEHPQGRQKMILESYEAALRDTVGLQSIRAVLAGYRLECLDLIAAAFDTASSFYIGSTDEEVRSQALTYMRRFLQESQTQYPERPQSSLMEGHVALIDGDERLAVKAFSRAEEQAERGGGVYSVLGRVAKEELAKLYRRLGKLGLALEYTVDVIEDYELRQRTPPGELSLNHVELLLALDRPREALDLVESLTPLFPDWLALKAARARALTALDQGEQAMREMEALSSDSPNFLFEQGKVAVLNEDYDTAVDLFSKVLETNPEHIPTIERLLRALWAAERTDEALQFIQGCLETTTNERLRRVLQVYNLVLSESDLEVRKQKQLEFIADISDEYERAVEFFNFWRSRGELPRALSYLDQMERLREDDARVLRLQFDLALQMNDCERAEKYLMPLGRLNVDQVGGATFRGRYELRCGQASKALAEYRAAEREFPRDSELKTQIARTLMSLKPPRYEEAIQMLSQAVEYDPRSFDAQKLLYACYEVTGRRAEGIPHLEAAAEVAARLRLKDDYIEARAQLLEEERNPRQGIENREKLREENAEDIANLLRLAELYEKVENFELARECLLSAAQVKPENLAVARFSANFFAERDDRETGEQLLQKHLEAQEGLGEIVARSLLGRFYETLADNEIRLLREKLAAGESQETVAPHREAVRNLRRLAFNAYQQAQARVGEALAGSSEDDRRRAIIISASELADFFRRMERFEDMIEAYRVVLSHLDPDETASIRAARLRIIGGLRSLKRYGEAREQIATYRREFPKDLRGMMAEAELLMADAKFDEARECLSRVLAEDPDSAWSLYMRGLINIQQQHYADARDDLLRAKDLAPESFKLEHRLDLSRLYELMDKPKLAEAELRELLPLERGGRDVELRLISLLQKTDQIERAQEFVNQMKARDPKQAFWPYQLGKLLMDREEYSAAARELQKSVELTAGTNPKAIEDWLQALVRGNRAGEAIRIYEGLNPAILTPPIKTYAAEAYLAEERREIAVPLLEQAISEASFHGVSMVRDVARRVNALLGRKAGLALVRGVLDRASEPDAEMVLQIALAEYLVRGVDSEDQVRALETVEAMLAEMPKDGVLRFEALLVQALALDQMGEPEKAVAVYEEALQLKPNDLRILNNLAYLLADQLERPAEALPYARELHETTPPNNPNILDTVGWVYFKAGNTTQAQPIFLEVLRIDPDNIATRYHLGLLYADSGRKADARREFRRVIELAREKQDADYIRKAEESLEKLR